MTTYRSDDVLVGLIGIAILCWIGWIIVRGFRNAELPIGRGQVRRDERPGAFNVLLGLYFIAAAVVGFIALDLLFGIRSRA